VALEIRDVCLGGEGVWEGRKRGKNRGLEKSRVKGRGWRKEGKERVFKNVVNILIKQVSLL